MVNRESLPGQTKEQTRIFNEAFTNYRMTEKTPSLNALLHRVHLYSFILQ